MAKLLGLKANDQVVQFLGPIKTRNYLDTTVTPLLAVQVFGTGSVQVQEASEYVIRSVGGDPNMWSTERVVPEDSWTDLGGPIDQAAGRTDLTPTIGDHDAFIRVIVVDPGEGKVFVRSDWR